MSGNGLRAEKGRSLASGDKISTGEGACDIGFDDKNIPRLFDNSETTIHLDREEKRLRLFRGAFAALARNLGRAMQTARAAASVRLRMETPTAVCGVRGAAFFVKMENSREPISAAATGMFLPLTGKGNLKKTAGKPPSGRARDRRQGEDENPGR
jgi:hypothetical protein